MSCSKEQAARWRGQQKEQGDGDSKRSKVTGTASSRAAGTARSKVAGTARSKVVGTARSKVVGTARSKVAGTARSKVAGTARSKVAGTARSKVVGTARSKAAGTAKSKVVGTARTFANLFFTFVNPGVLPSSCSLYLLVLTKPLPLQMEPELSPKTPSSRRSLCFRLPKTITPHICGKKEIGIFRAPVWIKLRQLK